MQAYITSFRKNKVDGKLLLRQDSETLHLLGINDADDRRVILNSLRQQLCLTCLDKSTLSIFLTISHAPAPFLPLRRSPAAAGMESWTKKNVGQWLELVGLGAYRGLFAARNVR